MMHPRNAFIAASLSACSAMAQGPKWSAPLPAVTQAGLHAVVLSPELMGRSNGDLSDLRLVDSTGREVPYVLRTPAMPTQRAEFVPYTLLRNEALPDRTEIELERPADQALDELLIRVRPADVRKHVRVTGSDDRAHWFMVKDDHLAAEGAVGDPPYQVLAVDVPRSDYRYYRVVLNDSLTPPMQVLGVGRSSWRNVDRPRFTPAGALHWTQVDSAHESRIRVVADGPIVLDRLVFRTGDTALFHRNGQVRAWRTYTVGRGRHARTYRTEEQLAAFTIGSDLARVIDVITLRPDTFALVIDNGDDRPVRFTDLRAYALEHLLVAQLEPGMRYRLTTGYPTRRAPRYDLAHFEATLPVPVDTLRPTALEPAPPPAAAGKAFDPSTWWVWAAIVVLMAGMGWLAVRLLRKMD